MSWIRLRRSKAGLRDRALCRIVLLGQEVGAQAMVTFWVELWKCLWDGVILGLIFSKLGLPYVYLSQYFGHVWTFIYVDKGNRKKIWIEKETLQAHHFGTRGCSIFHGVFNEHIGKVKVKHNITITIQKIKWGQFKGRAVVRARAWRPVESTCSQIQAVLRWQFQNPIEISCNLFSIILLIWLPLLFH